jgi:hypothetical protein
LVVIVYFLSKQIRVGKELQAVVQAKSLADNGTKTGVLTINLHNQGRGVNTRRTKIGLGWVVWREG